MIRPRAVPLLEIAEIVTAAFEELPRDGGRDACRLFRSDLTSRLKDRYGDDWVRAWNHVAGLQIDPNAAKLDRR